MELKHKETFPTPWDFSNVDKSMLSPLGNYTIEYGNLNEFGQGSPLQGVLYVKNLKSGKKAKIFELAGGPPIWSKNDDIAAVPIWWRGCLYGKGQKLLVINLQANEFIIYKNTFRVLHLKTFEGNIITGEDSPKHKPSPLNFDLLENKAMFKKLIPAF